MYLALLFTLLLIQFSGKHISCIHMHTYTMRTVSYITLCRYTLALVTVYSANVQCIHHSCLLPCIHRLLFTSNGSYVTFHKVNGQPVQGNTQCSSRLDPVLAMEADPSSRRLFWVSFRFGHLVLNWANYTREMCSNRCVCCTTQMCTWVFVHCCTE